MAGKLQGATPHLEKVATKALAGTFSDENAPRRLIQAVVHGSGERRGIEALTRGRITFDMVVFDTDRIGAFVFDSSRPPVIMGGSKILEKLNLEIGEAYPDATVFSGGGEGLLLFPAGEGAARCAEIETLFRHKSEGALSVTTAVLSVKPEDMLNHSSPKNKPAEDMCLLAGTRAVLARLRDQVRQKKERIASHVVPDSTARRCVSCRDRPGTEDCRHWRPDADMPLFLCKPCVRRWNVGKKFIGGISFQEIAAEWQKRNPTHVKDNYLGFLYSDGNAMGRFFAQLGSLAELRLVSGLVKKAFDVATQRVFALAETFQFTAEHILDLLGGGDEKIWILPATLALRVSRELPGWLTEALAQEPEWGQFLKRKGIGRTGITIGTGLVICDCKFPVQYQHKLATALQKSAKKRYYQGEENSFMDFVVVSDASPLAEDLEDARELAFARADPRFRLSLRPYSRGELESLLGKLLVKGATQSQVYALRDAAREGAAVFRNFVCYQAARLTDTYRAWLGPKGVELQRADSILGFFTDAAPGRPATGTWLGDGVELLPFLDGFRAGGD